MASGEDLSLAVLQGAGLSQVGLYPPSVWGRWAPLHTGIPLAYVASSIVDVDVWHLEPPHTAHHSNGAARA